MGGEVGVPLPLALPSCPPVDHLLLGLLPLGLGLLLGLLGLGLGLLLEGLVEVPLVELLVGDILKRSKALNQELKSKATKAYNQVQVIKLTLSCQVFGRQKRKTLKRTIKFKCSKLAIKSLPSKAYNQELTIESLQSSSSDQVDVELSGFRKTEKKDA